MNERSVKIDFLWLGAGRRMTQGKTFPVAIVAAVCMQTGNLSRRGRSFVVASAHGKVGLLEIAHQVRRLLAPLGPPGM